MLKIPSTQMEKLNIVYGAGTPNQVPNANAQWDLRQLKAFLDAPGNKPGEKKGFLYALLIEEGVQEDTIQTYMGSFGSLLTQYGVCGGARRLGKKTLTGLRDSQATYSKIRTAISNAMQPPPPDANLTILLLKSKSVPIYCAFKDVMDRSMHSLCLTEAPNFNQKTKTCNQDISPYMANIMMKANLKFGGGNHTVQLDNKPNTAIANSLQGTLVLGADLTHPSSSSLVGCPSIAAVVGSVNSKSTKYLGSMRLQRTCKKEVSEDICNTCYSH
jgi:eukaryotic translation initiation factor 2C